jgi:FlaG/FlaF family flagellin (archaellin)
MMRALIWNVNDDHPGTFELLKDGERLVWAVWTDSTISISLDGLSYGQYNYTLVIYDESFNEASDTVIVIVIDATDPLINSPADLEFVEGEAGHRITWSVNDDHPGIYELLQDGKRVARGPWEPPEVSISLDGLSYGQYNYTLVIYDESFNEASDTAIVIVIDTTDPLIDTPADQEFAEGETGHRITWSVNDDHPSIYELLQDGERVDGGSWESPEISISLDGLSYDQYNYTLIIYDESLNEASDTVIVTILDGISPVIIQSNPDITYTEGEINNTITWVAEDDHPKIYQITLADIIISSGSWTSYIPVTINVDNQIAGTYIYTIVFSDENGNMVQDSVILIVTSNTTTSIISSMITTSSSTTEITNTLPITTPTNPLIMSGFVFILSSILSIVILKRRRLRNLQTNC